MKYKNPKCIIISALFFLPCVYAETNLPLPLPANNSKTPIVSLNGTWKATVSPPEQYWRTTITSDRWRDVKVPGELRMQGFDIKQDSEIAYKTIIDIPLSFEGKKTVLRFEGVYNHTRVWINGHIVKGHFGGFTPWDCDITQWISPGESAEITLGVTDRADDISMGSGYAKHLMGGIIRDVRLMALPHDHLTTLLLETELDAACVNAILKIKLGFDFQNGKSAEIQCQLIDPHGKPLKLKPASIILTQDSPDGLLAIPVQTPEKWDAEHPNLYTLNLNVRVDGSQVQSFTERIGFRQVKQYGNKIFVNGREIKLRGANRHSIHPTDGRVLTADMEKQDVLLAKQANMNFIRTSHYPPTDTFLDFCDVYGIYVEDETAVTFVNVNHDSTQNSPEFADRYLSQVQEMVVSHYNHPSVIAWSIGNESVYGENFQACFDWIKSVDSYRPVVLSYPATIPDSVYCTDFLSVHYPFFDKISDELTSLYDPRIGRDKPFVYNNQPILYDEWAHVPTYNIRTIQEDPNVRNFWGRSLKSMWTSSFNEDGRLGGAIWCMIDDVFSLPPAGKDSAVTVSKFGNGEWGIVDAWRRKKPEFWHTRKAYSPVYIENKNIHLSDSSQSIELLIQNRFDHTNINELEIFWACGERSGRLDTISIQPHSYGVLTIPAADWHSGDLLDLKFYLKDKWLVDEFRLPVTIPSKFLQHVQKNSKEYKVQTPIVEDKDDKIFVESKTFKMVFDKNTGLIIRGEYSGRSVIKSGPFLQLLPVDLEPWTLKEISYATSDSFAVVSILGYYGEIDVVFELQIRGDGSFETDVTIKNPPPPPGNGDTWWPRNGFREVGIAFILDGSVDRLSWKRDGIWTVYPTDHIGRTVGTACRYRQEGEDVGRSKPAWPWSMDMRNPYSVDLNDPGFGATNDFRSHKESIYIAQIFSAETNMGLKVLSDGTQAIRLEPQGPQKSAPVKMIINTDWDYPDLGWGCYMKTPVVMHNNYQGTVQIDPMMKQQEIMQEN